MRITKTIAEQTANLLLAKKTEELKEVAKELSNVVTKVIERNIPLEISAGSKKNPEYFTFTRNFCLSGNGFNYLSVFTHKRLPCAGNNFRPNEKDAKEIMLVSNKFDNMVDEIKKLKLEIETAIFNLRTYKAVEENFPEAFLLLPKVTNSAIMVNLSEIRNKLN